MTLRLELYLGSSRLNINVGFEDFIRPRHNLTDE